VDFGVITNPFQKGFGKIWNGIMLIITQKLHKKEKKLFQKEIKKLKKRKKRSRLNLSFV
jgi:hypothetical protein